MRAIHLLLIIIIALAGCGDRSDRPAANVPATPIASVQSADRQITTPVAETRFTIVMLGDSLTAGFGLATREALPEQVALILERDGYAVNVVNAGVSGDTTAGGLARYDWSVASANPDLLIVALGANDFLGGIPAATARANLAAILARAQSDGTPVILASVEAGEIAQNDARIRAYAVIYAELAAEYDVPLFVDILSGVRGKPSLVQLDGLHPTREGVKVMAARMGKFIVPYLPADTQKAE